MNPKKMKIHILFDYMLRIPIGVSNGNLGYTLGDYLSDLSYTNDLNIIKLIYLKKKLFIKKIILKDYLNYICYFLYLYLQIVH